MIDSAQNSSHASRYWPPGLRAVWVIVISTLLIFLIFLSSGHIKLSQSAVQIVIVFVYSACIGVPSIFILTRIAFRYTDRFPRLVILMQALALACTSTAGTFLGGVILQFSGILAHNQYWHEVRGSLPFSVVISLMFGLSISTYETLRYKLQAAKLELSTRQVEQERAYKLLAEARLSSLESRIHPHFLFNTLNSIAAMIPSDPVRAEDTVGKLASLLRFSLNANQHGLVPLKQELKIVRDYLEIEKTRFGSRIRYEINVPEALEDARVPPLAIQSLVENAVKHVAAQRPQGASIQVTGAFTTGSGEPDRICLEVADDGPGFSLEHIDSEHGLGNLIGRLELLYGPNGRLDCACGPNRTAVRLSIPA